MSSPNSPILTLDVSARRTERWIASFALAGAVAGISLLSAFDPPSGVVVGAICGAFLTAGLRRAGWIGSRDRIATVSWRADGSWLLTDAEGHAVLAVLASDTRIGRAAVWLSWRTAAPGRARMLLSGGDLPADDLRRLIVRLRIQATERAWPDTAQA